jgi:hypothetical protein
MEILGVKPRENKYKEFQINGLNLLLKGKN